MTKKIIILKWLASKTHLYKVKRLEAQSGIWISRKGGKEVYVGGGCVEDPSWFWKCLGVSETSKYFWNILYTETILFFGQINEGKMYYNRYVLLIIDIGILGPYAQEKEVLGHLNPILKHSCHELW
jgi:hypothetical protein